VESTLLTRAEVERCVRRIQESAPPEKVVYFSQETYDRIVRMPRALRLPGVGVRRGLAAVRPPEFPGLNAASAKRLTGARTRDGWIDAVARSTGYTPAERDALTERMFAEKVKAYESRVTSELRRTGVLQKGDRWRMSPDDHSRTLLWNESERHSKSIGATYDRDRQRWAAQMKKKGGRLNRYAVASQFDEWNEKRASWKSKQIADSESMLADMRAGEEMYREAAARRGSPIRRRTRPGTGRRPPAAGRA
jgi:hypothetical protein